jgi:hypothetical protein
MIPKLKQVSEGAWIVEDTDYAIVKFEEGSHAFGIIDKGGYVAYSADSFQQCFDWLKILL